MSDSYEYCDAEMRSGDMYAAVPTHEARREKVEASWPDMPKSASFTSPRELRSTLLGLMSRCTTCRYTQWRIVSNQRQFKSINGCEVYYRGSPPHLEHAVEMVQAAEEIGRDASEERLRKRT